MSTLKDFILGAPDEINTLIEKLTLIEGHELETEERIIFEGTFDTANMVALSAVFQDQGLEGTSINNGDGTWKCKCIINF